MTSTPPPVLLVADLVPAHAREVTTTYYDRGGSKRERVQFELSPEGQRMLHANQRARAEWHLAHPDESRAETLAEIGRARRGRER